MSVRLHFYKIVKCLYSNGIFEVIGVKLNYGIPWKGLVVRYLTKLKEGPF